MKNVSVGDFRWLSFEFCFLLLLVNWCCLLVKGKVFYPWTNLFSRENWRWTSDWASAAIKTDVVMDDGRHSDDSWRVVSKHQSRKMTWDAVCVQTTGGWCSLSDVSCTVATETDVTDFTRLVHMHSASSVCSLLSAQMWAVLTFGCLLYLDSIVLYVNVRWLRLNILCVFLISL